MVGNPRRTDARMQTIPMSPPDFVGRDNKRLNAEILLDSGAHKYNEIHRSVTMYMTISYTLVIEKKIYRA